MKFTRRGFLGGLVAVSALPAVGKDDPTVFPARGKFERLVLAYQHVHIGLEKPFSVLHISDTHFTAAYPDEDAKKQKLREVRTKTFGGRQEEALCDSLAWAKENVDYVVHTGDLIDWQSRANFDLVKKHFGAGLCGAVGNHEFSPDMWLGKDENSEAHKAKTRAPVAAAYPFDIELASTVVNGVNFVTLDDVYGYVTAHQVERFAAEVKKGLPIVLCMHVPFFSAHIWRAHEKFWRAGRARRLPQAADRRRDARFHRLPQARTASEGHSRRTSAHHGAGPLLAHRDAVCRGRKLHVPRPRGPVHVNLRKVFVVAMDNEAAAVTAHFNPEVLLNVGVAGALHAPMQVAEVYRVRAAVQYDFDLAAINGTSVGTLNEYTARELPLDRAGNAFPEALLATGDRFNDSLVDYRFLVEDVQADLRDMEGAAIAHVARRANVPLRALKAVSDVAGSGSTADQYHANLTHALKALSDAIPAFFGIKSPSALGN